MKRKNELMYGKNCIGQSVYDRDGNHAVIVDMRTIDSGSKCVVDILYDNGAKQTREKYHVSLGKFAKPGEFNVKAALSTDEWKPLYGFEDYYIVSRGGEFVRVKGVNRRRAKKTHIGSNGYERISLYRDGRAGRELAFVHRCIVQTFIRPINDDEEVNHIDGDRTNNALYNLEILPKKENNKKYIDMKSLGLTDDHLERIREHCSSEAINLKEFLGRCVISYLEDVA